MVRKKSKIVTIILLALAIVCCCFGMFAMNSNNQEKEVSADTQTTSGWYAEDNTSSTPTKTWAELKSGGYITVSSGTLSAAGSSWSRTKFDSLGDGKLVIDSEVTSIGDSAFSNCSGLTSIEIPSSVTSIGTSVFKGCSGLTSIVVDGENTVFDSRNNCNAIIKTGTNELILGCKNTVIPSSITSIGSSAFSYCSGLTSIEIPSSVTSIGDSAFSYCSGLTSIGIPSSVTSMGTYTFRDCSGLTSIEIPSSVTSIGEYTFNGCSGLTSIAIPSSVTSIGNNAFYDCSGLTSIEIQSGVTSIGYYAFYSCSGLTSIEIPSSVTSIGSYAFVNCEGLTSLIIPASVTCSIGSLFAHPGPGTATCRSLKDIYFLGTEEQWLAIGGDTCVSKVSYSGPNGEKVKVHFQTVPGTGVDMSRDLKLGIAMLSIALAGIITLVVVFSVKKHKKPKKNFRV